jgi:hypothetical protein
MQQETEKAYKQILKLINKHKDLITFDIEQLEKKAKDHLFFLQLKEEYGFNLDPKQHNMPYNKYYNNFNSEYKSISWWGDKHPDRKISWSDDGKQPENEWLFKLSFSTGAYSLGSDYDGQQELFQQFFNELKTYSPKYLDTTNKSLYFSLDNAGKIFNEFDSILKKYVKLNQEDYKRRQIIKMEKELEKLKTQ